MDFVVLTFLIYCDIIRLKHVATFHQTNNWQYLRCDRRLTHYSLRGVQNTDCYCDVLRPRMPRCWLSVSGQQHSLTLKKAGYTDMFLSLDSRILCIVKAPLSKPKKGQNHAATSCQWSSPDISWVRIRPRECTIDRHSLSCFLMI